MKKVLIVGGSGFIGMKLIELRPNDLNITVTYNESEKNIAGVTWEKCDLKKTNETSTLLHRASPDVIINVSKAPFDSIEPLIGYAKNKKIKLVHISTDAVFDGTKGNYTITDEPHPITQYGIDKRQEEEVIMSKLEKYAIIRTSYVYGKSGGNWDKRTLGLQKVPHMVAYENMCKSPTPVDDLAKKIWKVALGDYQGIFHIAGSKINMPDFFNMLAKNAGFKIEVETKEYPDADIPLDTSLINSEL